MEGGRDTVSFGKLLARGPGEGREGHTSVGGAILIDSFGRIGKPNMPACQKPFDMGEDMASRLHAPDAFYGETRCAANRAHIVTRLLAGQVWEFPEFRQKAVLWTLRDGKFSVPLN